MTNGARSDLVNGANSAPTKPPFCRIRFLSCKDVFLCTKALGSFLYRRNLPFWLFFSGTFPFKMWAHSHKLLTRFSFPLFVMTLAKSWSTLARRQRHNAFLFYRADISNDECDYDVFLFMSWECKHTGTSPSQVGYYSEGTGVPVGTVSSPRISSREVRTLCLWMRLACTLHDPDTSVSLNCVLSWLTKNSEVTEYISWRK